MPAKATNPSVDPTIAPYKDNHDIIFVLSHVEYALRPDSIQFAISSEQIFNTSEAKGFITLNFFMIICLELDFVATSSFQTTILWLDVYY